MPKGIEDLFLRSIFRLLDWEYSKPALKQNKLFIRGILDKFIYQPLSEEAKIEVDELAKSEKLPIPPNIKDMWHLKPVDNQLMNVFQIINTCKTFDEFEEKFDAINEIKPSNPQEFEKILKELLLFKK